MALKHLQSHHAHPHSLWDQIDKVPHWDQGFDTVWNDFHQYRYFFALVLVDSYGFKAHLHG